MNAATTVIVMAKAPVPGFAKTRLVSALGADRAAALAERLLHAAVADSVAAALGPVDLCCAPDRTHPAFARYRGSAGIQLSDQGEGDLGARMARAFERRLVDGQRAVMIGSDAPALDAALLSSAASALSGADAVLVPAFDGGYALIGLRRPAPSLFDAMPWSTPAVMAQTRERLAAAGLTHIELPAVADIDEAADLVHLPPGWLP
ncbi:MAG: TIGR04282 family arsenosugar biosynthesis glycosyltransferase [Pseudomonadota bacterium]|nr:TIGR04282 family arsenosugar biosynthesis glycosyltransferase [Pseudomonadota bacterium]